MFNPINKKVVIEPIKPSEKTKNGIILPDTVTKSDITSGKVIAVGKNCMDVVENDTVLLDTKLASKFTHNDISYVVIEESDILLILK